METLSRLPLHLVAQVNQLIQDMAQVQVTRLVVACISKCDGQDQQLIELEDSHHYSLKPAVGIFSRLLLC